MASENKLIPLTRLQLFEQNPRHGEVQGQPAIIDWMLEQKQRRGSKLIKLAEAIVTNGWDEADLVLVVQDTTDKARYIVVEGNRRITALKLLNNPQLAVRAAYVRRFQALRDLPDRKDIPKSIVCSVQSSLEECWSKLEARHHGEANGVGRVAWGPREQGRFNELRNKTSRYAAAERLLDVAESLGMEIIENFPITTLDRLVKDKEVQKRLGIGVDKGEIVYRIDPKESEKIILKVIDDLQDPDGITVDTVKTKFDRENYLDSLPKRYQPDLSKILESPLPIAHPKPTTLRKTSIARTGTRISRYLSIKAKPTHTSRAFKITGELKKLRPDDCPNAIAMLLRVLLELSINEYIQKNRLKKPQELRFRLGTVVESLEHGNKISKDLAKTIRKLGDADPTKWLTIDTFNQFAHSSAIRIVPKDVRLLCEMLDPFIELLWDNMR